MYLLNTMYIYRYIYEHPMGEDIFTIHNLVVFWILLLDTYCNSCSLKSHLGTSLHFTFLASHGNSVVGKVIPVLEIHTVVADPCNQNSIL